MHAIVTTDNFNFKFLYEENILKTDGLCIPFMMVNDAVIEDTDLNITECKITFKDNTSGEETSIQITHIDEIESWEFLTEELDKENSEFKSHLELYKKSPYEHLVELELQINRNDKTYVFRVPIVWYTDKKNRTFHKTYVSYDEGIKDIYLELKINVKVPRTILQKYPLN